VAGFHAIPLALPTVPLVVDELPLSISRLSSPANPILQILPQILISQCPRAFTTCKSIYIYIEHFPEFLPRRNWQTLRAYPAPPRTRPAVPHRHTIMSSARCNPAHGKRKCTRCVLRAGAFACSHSLTVLRARTTARSPLLGRLFTTFTKPWAAGHLPPHQCHTPHEQLHDEGGSAGGIARACTRGQ
jgi:hypothetical protein